MRETRLRRWRTRRSAFRKQSVESHACSLCKAPRQRTCRTVHVPFVICQGAKKSQRSLGIIPRCCINDCRQVDSSSRDQLNEKRREIRVARLYCAGCGSQTTTVGNRSVAANRSTAADQSRLKKDDGLSRWFTRPSLPGAAVLGRRTPRLTARRVCLSSECRTAERHRRTLALHSRWRRVRLWARRPVQLSRCSGPEPRLPHPWTARTGHESPGSKTSGA